MPVSIKGATEFLPQEVQKTISLPFTSEGGGAVAQSVERASPGDEILGSIPSDFCLFGWFLNVIVNY